MADTRFRESQEEAEKLLRDVAARLRVPEGDDRYAVGVALYFATKVYRLAKAIRCLVAAGLATEARIILRSICEHYIVHGFIQLDPKERPSAFVDFLPIHQQQWVERLRAHDETLELGDEFLDSAESKLKDAYDELVDDYRTEGGKVRKSWTSHNFYAQAESVAKETGADDTIQLYNLLYRPLSEGVHPSSSDFRFYVRADASGEVVPVLDGDVQEPDVIDLWTALLCVKLATGVNAQFDLGLDEQVERVDKDLNARLKEGRLKVGSK